MDHPYDVGHQQMEQQLIILEHRKNYLDEVQARSGAVTHQEIDACSHCQIVE